MLVPAVPSPAWLLLLAGCRPPHPADTGVPAAEPYPYLVDSEGRTVIYRGMNVDNGSKGAEDHMPTLPDGSLELLASSGFTLVRALVFWEGVQPEEDVFDEDYLADVDALLTRYDELGVDVLLDMHQDLWREGFGSAGAPAWACDQANYDSYEHPGGSWWAGYLTEEVSNCFQDFWDSERLQDHYAEAWARLAQLARAHERVVGYDLMNEPFFARLDQPAFEQQILPAFYERVRARIREVDSDTCGPSAPSRYCRWVGMEPSTHANLLQYSIFQLPESDDPAEVPAFLPHFYPLYAEEGTGFDGDLEDETENLQALCQLGQAQGAPCLLGEYGIFSSAGNEHDYVRGVQDAVEATGGSSAYWSYAPSDSHGVIDGDYQSGFMMPAFQRPYLHRIPGRLLELTSLGVGMQASWEPDSDAALVAVVPEECDETEVSGASVLDQQGPIWQLLPDQQASTVTVSIEGC